MKAQDRNAFPLSHNYHVIQNCILPAILTKVRGLVTCFIFPIA
jgi:hypothetical protein